MSSAARRIVQALKAPVAALFFLRGTAGGAVLLLLFPIVLMVGLAVISWFLHGYWLRKAKEYRAEHDTLASGVWQRSEG